MPENNQPDTPKKELEFFQKDKPKMVLIICLFSLSCVYIASLAYSGANTPVTTTQTTTLSTFTQTQINEICMNQYLQNGSATYKIQSCPPVEYVSSSPSIFGFPYEWIFAFILIVFAVYCANLLGPHRRF